MHESTVLHWPIIAITNCYVIVNLVYEANQLGHAVAIYL